MLRRDFVCAVISASFAPRWLLSQQTANPAPPPPAPVPWTLGLNSKIPLAHTEVVDEIAETEPTFFTRMQMATLVRFCNILLPPIGSKPGALQAKTPAFLDFLIGNSQPARRKTYQEGLDWLDSESHKRYMKAFATLDDREADTILKPWLRTWMTDHPPTEPHADFVNIAHEDIRMATINSKPWSDALSADGYASIPDGLYWYPIEPDIDMRSSDRTPARVITAPKETQTIPAYQR